MVTDYNRYTIMKRKMEMAEEAEKAKSAVSPLITVENTAEPVIKENLTTESTEESVEDKPKTDAEKLKRGRKKNV